MFPVRVSVRPEVSTPHLQQGARIPAGDRAPGHEALLERACLRKQGGYRSDEAASLMPSPALSNIIASSHVWLF